MYNLNQLIAARILIKKTRRYQKKSL